MTTATVLTLSRLLFFAGFIRATVGTRADAVLVFFVLAWGLDAVDGWVARRFSQETVLGSSLDKAVDRVVLMGGFIALLAEGWIPLYLLLLLTKDFIVLPAAAVRASAGEASLSAGTWGKLVSTLQGFGFIVSILHWPGLVYYVMFVALAGVGAGGVYVWKTFSTRNPYLMV